VLNEMKQEGHYPETFWQYADQVAAGKAPGAFKRALAC
jgi:hypothetical protein